MRDNWTYTIKRIRGVFYIQDKYGNYALDQYGGVFRCFRYEDAIAAVRYLEDMDDDDIESLIDNEDDFE